MKHNITKDNMTNINDGHWRSTPNEWISMHGQQNLDDNSSSSHPSTVTPCIVL